MTQPSRVGLLVAASSVLAAAAAARGDVPLTSFMAGDLVVLRGGDATNSDASGGNAFSGEVNAYLDEYTTGGAYVGTVPAPATLTLPGEGQFQHEGVLNRSADGRYLSFAGYTTPAGTTARPVDGSATATLALVGASAASLNATTTITPAQGTGQYVRGATTVNGGQFYAFGKFPAGATPGFGLDYVGGVGPAAAVTNLQGTTDWRDIITANGTLYGGTGSSSVGTHGAYQIGTAAALPTAPTPADTLLTNYAGGNSASALALVDVPTADVAAKAQNGLDVLYTIGDQGSAGITKYYFDGTTWQHADLQVTLNATNVVNPTGIEAVADPSNPAAVDLYVSGENGIYSFVDASGDPAAPLPANAFTLLVAAPANEAFYGLAPAPSAVPEPAAACLVAAGAVAALPRRRRA